MDTYIECVTDELSCSESSIEGVCPEEYEEVAACAGGVGAGSEDSTSTSSSRTTSRIAASGHREVEAALRP